MRIILGLAVAIAVVAMPALAQEIGNAGDGEALAMAACSNCHLVREGQRNPPMDSVPSFDAIARDPKLTADGLRLFLNRPHWPMPDLGLSRQQIADAVSYISELRSGVRSTR